ncbi:MULTISPECIES: HNH endonuclease [unclassified Photobacterium]|nr:MULTISPECIES: HNH endonuclease [unclassified Photobacterium]
MWNCNKYSRWFICRSSTYTAIRKTTLTADNILCLCPNHHVMFDNGVFSISNNFTLIGIEGELRTTTKHEIGKQFLEYHRDHYLNQNKN